jgi:hypothetical protein
VHQGRGSKRTMIQLPLVPHSVMRIKHVFA